MKRPDNRFWLAVWATCMVASAALLTAALLTAIR